jgi:hypothetical protein
MARDYKAEYKRRAEKARREGFRSPREKVAYTKVKKSREKKLTLYNYRKSIEAARRKAKAQKSKTTATARARALKKVGVTLAQFNRIRAANRAFNNKLIAKIQASKNGKGGSPRLLYNTELDNDYNNWTNERVGYIVYYYQVFVKPDTKKLARGGRQRENLVNKYSKLIEQFDLFADYQDLVPFKYAREQLA